MWALRRRSIVAGERWGSNAESIEKPRTRGRGRPGVQAWGWSYVRGRVKPTRWHGKPTCSALSSAPPRALRAAGVRTRRIEPAGRATKRPSTSACSCSPRRIATTSNRRPDRESARGRRRRKRRGSVAYDRRGLGFVPSQRGRESTGRRCQHRRTRERSGHWCLMEADVTAEMSRTPRTNPRFVMTSTRASKRAWGKGALAVH
jgi:hypothetical protein